MDIILIVLLVLLVGIASSILYLNLKSKPRDDNENKETEEIANLKTEIQNLKDTLNNTNKTIKIISMILYVILLIVKFNLYFLFRNKMYQCHCN